MEMVVIIRPSFKKFCGDDACRAALFNHLLYWIAKKCKDQLPDQIKKGEFYWYGSVEKEISDGLVGSWGISKIKKELKALISDGLIGQRHNPTRGWDRTYQYFIGEEQGKAIQKTCEKHGVDLGKLDLVPEILHLLNATEALVKNNQSISSNQPKDQTDITDSIGESNQAVPKVPTKISTKRRQREMPAPVAQPPTSSTPKPSLSLSENSSQKVPTLPSHLLKKAKGVS